MSVYKVTERVINIHAGVLVLDAAQADARMYGLTALGNNRYDVSRPVQFKRGEVFELEGELPKAIVQGVVEEGFSKVCEEPGKKDPPKDKDKKPTPKK